MENNTSHTLSIINGDVKLDGFTVKGVIDYNLKASYEKGTTINLTLLVKSQEVVVTNEKEAAQEGSISESDLKVKYEEIVQQICSNRLIGFSSKEEDAQLIAKIIETLTGKENLSIGHAQAILSDMQIILPMIVKL